MITKRMVDEMDAKIAEERKEILKVAEEAGISYEEVVELENNAMHQFAKDLVVLDRNGVFDQENREHGEV